MVALPFDRTMTGSTQIDTMEAVFGATAGREIRSCAAELDLNLAPLFAALLVVLAFRLSGERFVSIALGHGRVGAVRIGASDTVQTLARKIEAGDLAPCPASDNDILYCSAADTCLDVRMTQANFALGVRMECVEERIMLQFAFRPDMLSMATVGRWMHHLETLASAWSRNPSQVVSSLPLLDAAERRRAISDWNNTACPYPKEPFHRLVSAQARRTPDLPAVVCEHVVLSYSELETRSNQLSHRLIELGVGPEAVVGMCLKRSVDLLVVLLAIMKAGGAYLPLDPAYPRDRLGFIVRDARPQIVVTKVEHASLFRNASVPLLVLDEEQEQLSRRPNDAPHVELDSDNLAYVIYTSGSTGKPKGVLICHRGLSNLVGVVQKGFDVRAGDRALLYHSMSFDFSVWEIAMALPFGASLHVTKDNFSAFELAAFMSRSRINVASLTSSALQFLDGVDLPDLRILTTGAEACAEDLASYWAARCEFYHGYGPTEVTTGCAYHRYQAGAVTIGRPMQNLQVYVLDENMEPVPVGVIGEIYIGGVGLARGYLGRGDLTAARFVPNPFGKGDRLYRSGDMGRWLPDGALAFAGRADQQVKIGGYRVEIAEVEAALARLETIRQVAVVAVSDAAGAQWLIAYAVIEGERSRTSDDLRKASREFLPPYMIPSRFVAVNCLPTTASGKLDRNALKMLEYVD
ncbi:amino acid adenylation domain-containing protein [Bradyrhizobium sp. 21]|uniref:non-ribosomal peptide synthetase n=1 Tax=Bradyrhizobium sp. 21 TaxID=2782666 RepID=UPI001FFB4F78|nr:amino acid adenylation domain-containing protein [Bradyrhizobium sp. 21]MCK1387654.1 amino acid adenylation domain-containing protein [Bradyrhizobium sp. 21]